MNTVREKIRVFHLRSSGGMYGAEAVILNIARELDQDGCVNHICCINNLKNPHAELAEAARNFGIAASSVDSISLLDWEAVKEVRAKLESGRFNILHCHDYKASLYGLLASRGMKIRRVVTNHGWTHVSAKLHFYEIIEGFSYNIFDRVIAVSDTARAKILPFILYYRSRIGVVENGIDSTVFSGRGARTDVRRRFGLLDDDAVVGIVGRVSPEKGHECLLRAMAVLLAQTKGPAGKPTQDEPPVGAERLRLLIVGDGLLEEKLKAMCAELGLPVFDIRNMENEKPAQGFPPFSVIFTGARSDMPVVYQAIDMLAMPSLSEGLPMALLEAMAAGVPVVATPVGQIPKIIKDGETGFLIQPQDADGLAAVIQKVLRRGAATDIEAMIRRARALVEEKYSSRAMAKKYLEEYEWLAQ